MKLRLQPNLGFCDLFHTHFVFLIQVFLVTHYWVDNIIIILVTLGCVCNDLIAGTVIIVTMIAPGHTPRDDIYIAYSSPTPFDEGYTVLPATWTNF